MGKTILEWQILPALMIIFSICRQVVSASSSTNVNHKITSSISSYKSDIASSARLRLEHRWDDGDTPEKSSPRLNPMISPRYSSRAHKHNAKSIQKLQDSYLDALNHSHTIKLESNSQKITRREYVLGPVYRRENSNITSTSIAASQGINNQIDSEPKISRVSYEGSVFSNAHLSSGSTNSYQQQPIAPSSDYGSHNSYSSYGSPMPPRKAYGPPMHHSYGPPVSYPTSETSYSPYGSSQQGSLQATYSASYPLPDIFPLALFSPIDVTWPLSLKINAYTLIKIILKLVIFKIIVKFIAVVCLILFLPKLIHKEHGQIDDESREIFVNPDFSAERLPLLIATVARSIRYFRDMTKKENKPNEPCWILRCRIIRLLNFNETWTDYIQLFKSYTAEEPALAQNKMKSIWRRK